MEKNIGEVIDYFAKKANHYDDVDGQLYWELSDDILWYILKKEILSKFSKTFNLLDAGGGTARWSLKILEHTNCIAEVFDISENMLAVADKKIREKKLNSRVKLIEGNLDKFETFSKTKFDLIISMNNVFSFVDSPKNALSNIVKVTNKGGLIVLMVANKYHALYFNIQRNALEQLDMNLNESYVKFTEEVPKMHTYTPKSLKKLCTSVGIKPLKILGFPVTIYPGTEETKIFGNTKKLETILSNKKNYNKILEIEKKVCLEDETASRGNMLLLIAMRD
ncbi:MAG: class I SAM-dependent methyltransferase [DPANN group archaeon]|nr:class I SAM-dependent methyltransferase [DPANN group archaeon]